MKTRSESQTDSTSALILTFSPGEKEPPVDISGLVKAGLANPAIQSFENEGNLLPLLGERVGVRTVVKTMAVLLLLSTIISQPSTAFAQNYAIDWHKVAGGGGTSTGATYSVTGTIGQPDANAQSMTGGSYALTGGFWSLISAVQTPGLPNLTITHVGNSVTVSWLATGSYTLQQNANLTTAGGWVTSGYPITTANSTNSVTIAPPTGNLFFRLTVP